MMYLKRKYRNLKDWFARNEEIKPITDIEGSNLETVLKKNAVQNPEKFVKSLIDAYNLSGGFMGDCVPLDDFEEHFYSHLKNNGLDQEASLLHLYVKLLGELKVLVGHSDYENRVCLDECWGDELSDYFGLDDN
jgi:hypothetical protein